MKPYLLALSLLVAGPSAYAQPAAPLPLALPVDPDTHQITYSGIIAVPSVTKNQLYARGMIWFGTAFYADQSVLLADDQQAGFLVGRSYISGGAKVWCVIKLSFQEGRYRYILTDFQFEGQYHTGHHTSVWRSSAESMCFPGGKDGTPSSGTNGFSTHLDQAAQLMIASIESGMSQAAGGSPW